MPFAHHVEVSRLLPVVVHDTIAGGDKGQKHNPL
jgi:hypothetical protein